jgi:hypothetical protein
MVKILFGNKEMEVLQQNSLYDEKKEFSLEDFSGSKWVENNIFLTERKYLKS